MTTGREHVKNDSRLESGVGSVAESAAELRALGFAICRVDAGEKKPTYNRWPTRSLEASDFAEDDLLGVLGGPLSNCGRPGHALVIIDLDDPAAVDRADEFLPVTGMEEGRKGKPRDHRYFLVPASSIPSWACSTASQAAPAATAADGHPGPFKKQFRHAETSRCVIDFIGTGGQVVCPGGSSPRQWVGGEPGEPAVVPFPELWDATCKLAVACGCKLPEANGNGEPHPLPFVAVATNGASVEDRAIAFLAKIPGAISGKGGHKQLFWAARVLVYGFDLGRERGLRLLVDHYNDRCKPKWTKKELAHKCREADVEPYKKPRGWLLDESSDDQATDTDLDEDEGRKQDQGETDAEGPPIEQEGDGTQRTITNFAQVNVGKGDKKKAINVALPLAGIAEQLQRITPGWPKCVRERLLVAEDGYTPLWLDSADAVFAWIARKLPPSPVNPIHWSTQGKDMVTAGRFVAYLKQTAEQYDTLARYPHWPPLPDTFYLHPPLTGGDGKALARLLQRYNPASEVDRSLILALHLTLVWGGSPGRRPGFLATRDMKSPEDGRGIGKSTLIQKSTSLVGGQAEFDTSAKRDEIVTRLLSDKGQAIRAAMLDNIKTLRFSWAELEGLITSPVISGHQMYYGEGQRPNHMTWCLTLNGAGLSRDIAQRIVPIWLKKPERYSATWLQETDHFISENRWAILGDLVALLKNPPAMPLSKFSRWGDWERDVLSRVPNAAECQKVIGERQGSMDADAEETDVVHDYFADRLRERRHDPTVEVIRIPSALAAEWLELATAEKRPTGKATIYLAGLGVPELRKSDRGDGRGWVWQGKDSPTGATAVPVGEATDESEGPVGW